MSCNREVGPQLPICFISLALCIYPVKVRFMGQSVFTVWLSALELFCCIFLLCNNGLIQFIT